MNHGYTWQKCLTASEKSNWRVEDLIGGDKLLDFSRPFLPDSLARAGSLEFLGQGQKLALNQIRAHGYLYMFGLVEEFILPFVLDHARERLVGDDYRVRALLRFAGEEAKHIHLFNRFREEFRAGFGTECGVIGPAEEIGRHVLGHHPLAVALTVLHVEWMTQRHYTESVHDAQELDPQFKSLLRHHWMEEAQHARLDVLMVESLKDVCDEGEIAGAVESYLAIGGFLDEGFARQVELDLDSLQRATGRRLAPAEQDRFREVQRQAMRWTFLGSGMTHETFLSTLEQLLPTARPRVEAVAAAFC